MENDRTTISLQYVPLRLSSRTVLRLPRGANCRAKQRGWMLMPTRETIQGCCKECNILASWRYSEKLRQASADCRCFTMVSETKEKGTIGSTKVKKGILPNRIRRIDLNPLILKILTVISLHALIHLCPSFTICNSGGLCVSV